jgi:DNA-binding response OmpR family regulator
MTSRPKILVVDDDAATLLTVAALLEEEGYDVIRQETSLGTSSLLLRERPDLVLLDVNMPALRGDDLALLIQQNSHLASTRVLLYSGSTSDKLELLVRRTGADGYVQKSGDPRLLLATVKRLVTDGKGPSGADARGKRRPA